MQQLAKQFIDNLEAKHLLSPDIVEELRRQVAESKTRLTPELLAKLLVDNGHLTKFQATKLIEEIKTPAEDESASNGDANDELGFAPEAESEAEPEDELGFAPEADEPEADELVSAEEVAEAPASTAEVAAVFIDDEEPVEVVAVEAVEEVAEVAAVEVESPSDSAFDSADSSSSEFDSPRAAPKPIRPATKKDTGKWESFRILGTAVILGLVLIGGAFLIYYFVSGSAEDRLNAANDAYEQRSYETASTMYSDFAESFTTHEKNSFAKVRSGLAALRRDSEGAPNPSIGLETALEVLPTIADEPALQGEQSDLAGALIALATKFNERADDTEETQKRRELMQELDQLMALIDDPKYVGGTARQQYGPTLDRIQENRSRIMREINRDDSLTAALSEIDTMLDANDTMAAYGIREKLILEYPLLEADKKLIERVERASTIQQSLVASGNLSPTLSKTAPNSPVGRSFILANKTGEAAASLRDQTIFVKVKGSVYGLDGSGDVLWRHYVGREFKSHPIRLGETSDVDAIVCQPEKGHVSRLDGRTGEVAWFVDFGSPVHMPVAESEDLFVTTRDGQVASLDLVSGQIKWTKKLPQPIPVAPGLAFGKPHLYIPAEHSNLYVLSRRDGSCKEVHYLGHRAGSIAIPPELLLGQLFVFENINTESSKVRILSVSDEGLELTSNQVPVTLEGNIMVSPQSEGRRIYVQSDLGQIIVLDVEPTADTNKVTTIATIPKNLYQPTLSFAAVGRNKLWVADSRLTRFDLQVSLGKLNRAWIKNDGDVFAGPPQLFDDVLIHTRSLRGNQGVRVAAVDAESGEPIWETDLGVPVTMLKQTADEKIDVVNSGGMYFQLENSPLRDQADLNPGQGKSSMLFQNPVAIGDDAAVLLNASKPNQLAYYSASGTKLSILSANFGSAKPSCPPIGVEGNLAIGLDNGQFILLDPTNGALAASPFQPPMEPGKTVTWNRPVYIANTQTLIVSSTLQKLVRLSVGDSLRALTEVDLESPLVGPLAVVGNKVCGVNSSRSGDSLMFFEAISLEKANSFPLTGRVIAGPIAHDDFCIVQTDSKLIAVTAEAQEKWSIDFPKSKLLGDPLSVDGNLGLTTTSGEFWLIDPATGNVIGKQNAGQALSSAPIIRPTGILVGSDEGGVLALPLPSGNSEAP